jgi:hypothetical protein
MGNKLVVVLLMFVMLAMGAHPAKAQPGGSWQQTFVDDFTTNASLTAPNSPWITGYPWGQTLNNELEYYTRYSQSYYPSCNVPGLNHIFSGGTMSLIAKYEPGNYEVWSWPNNVFTKTCNPYQYTSGMIFSKDRYLYGYFEIKARIPHNGTVFWPAFWLWAGDGGYREIDVFEFGGTTPDEDGMNMHIEAALEGGYVHSNHDSTPPYLNHYPNSTIVPGVSNGFHRYGVRWSPNNVVWYVDGAPVYQQPGHVPPKDMYIIADHAIHPWAPFPAVSDFPQSFEIDWIRAWRSLDKELLWHWGNGGTNQLDWWSFNHSTDQLVTGDFDNDGRDELIATNAGTGYAHLMGFDGTNWSTPWANNGNHRIHWWYLSVGDSFVAGDFNGDGRDELLAISGASGYAHLMRFNGSTWSTPWMNNGNHRIHWWYLSAGDRFVVGDFDGDGRDELLAISAASGYAHLMKFNGTNWTTMWSNSSNHRIHWWYLSVGDSFVAGDFNGDGRDELLAISAASGYAHLMKYASGTWSTPWTNGGNHQINWWYLNPGDQLMACNFDGNGADELLATSTGGWSQMMKYMGGGWSTPWSNEGARTIHLWHMKPTDRYIAANFDPQQPGGELLSKSINGWVHLHHYDKMPLHP